MKRLYTFIAIAFNFFVLNVQAQEDSALENQFLSFISNHPVERVLLTTPTTINYTGDTLLISGLVLDLFGRSTSQISQIMKVSLFDTSGTARYTLTLKNNEGTFSGKWFIPHEISSGNYFLVAHTAYMSNFDLELRDAISIYIKNIWEQSNHSYMELVNDKSIHYYPEGGKLIAGHNQKLVIATSSYHTQGTITDSKKKVVLNFQLEDGWTTTYFTPQSDEIYHITTWNEETSNALELRPDKGATLSVSKVGTRYFINVLSDSTDHKNLLLAIESENRFQSTFPVELNEEHTATFVIPEASLSGTFHTIALLRNDIKIEALRAFSLPPDPIEVEVHSEYTIQSSATVSAKLPSDNPYFLNLSVGKDHSPSLAQRMALSYAFTNLQNRIPYTQNSLPINDLLSVLAPSLHTKWETILSENREPTKPHIDPELGIDIRGKIEGNHTPTATLNFYQWEDGISYYTTLNSDGSFYLPLPDFKGNQTFTYDLRDPSGAPQDHASINFEAPKIPILSFDFEINQSIDSLIKTELALKRMVAQYMLESTQNQPSLYDKLDYDRIYNMEDYVILPKFDEVVIDILMNLGIKNTKNGKELRMSQSEQGTFRNRPTIIIDDAQLPSNAFLWDLPPLYISEIKILGSSLKLGKYGGLGASGGIVGIKLKQDAAKSFKSAIPENKQSIEGFLQQDLESREAENPNFTTVLVHSSTICSSNSLQTTFKTSNSSGLYHLTIEGISKAGHLVSGTTSFIVKLPVK